MSQEKVTKYKEEKANRKETMKKKKMTKLISKTITGLVCIAIIGWVGYSGVTFYIESQPREAVEVDYTAIDNFLKEHTETE